MCELFGACLKKRMETNDYLKKFYSHSNNHPHGWGLACIDEQNVSLEKEPLQASKSNYLKKRLSQPIQVKTVLAHIRYATIGNVDYCNCHPYSQKDNYYENGEYKSIEVSPQIEDLQYLRTFKFEDLTFRGTIEFRSVCCQPIKDSMTVAAFHLGLNKNLYKLNELLSQDHVLYHHEYTATELRKMLVKNELPEFIDKKDLHDLIKQILDLSYEGLSARGFGEESMLSPLYDRLETSMNPAQKMLALKNNGVDLEDIILDYGKINALS